VHKKLKGIEMIKEVWKTRKSKKEKNYGKRGREM